MKKKTTCAPKTAVAYARYSSAGQRDVSIEQQLQDIRAYAEREGYTIIHEYADHARSGFRHVESRLEFQAMIAAAATGTFDTVLCWKVDRFGRNRADSAIYKNQLASLGVTVRYVMEAIPDGAAGVLTEGMLEAIAEWYSRNLSENVKRGMNDNASKCLFNGTFVYGYDGRRNQTYQINEPQAAVVRQIFAMYIDGQSMGSIAKSLNIAGQRTESGKLFTINKINNILKQERYLGIYIFGDHRIPGGMPAIIDEKTWEDAQLMKGKTSRHYERTPDDFLLTGKAFCGHCGRPMVGDSGTSKTGATHYYYSCQSHKRRLGCSKKSVRKEVLEDKVIDFLVDQVLSGPNIETIADAVCREQKKRADSSPLRAMEQELSDTERKIANINAAIAEGIFSSSTAAMLHDLEETAGKLRVSIEARRFAEMQLVDRERIVYFLSRFSHCDRKNPTDRRFLIRAFLNSVFVYDDHLRILINCTENTAVIALEDLPPEGKSSDSNFPGLLMLIYPNSVIAVYEVRM